MILWELIQVQKWNVWSIQQNVGRDATAGRCPKGWGTTVHKWNKTSRHQESACFVQRCAVVTRGIRNAPKQFPKAASLCFMNSVPYFAIHKGVVTTTSRGSKGTKYPRKIGKMRPTVPALLRILPQIVIVKDVEMSLRTHTEARQRT